MQSLIRLAAPLGRASRHLTLRNRLPIIATTIQTRGLAEAFERTKPHLNVGTIGHGDHGKVSNLTSTKINVHTSS